MGRGRKELELARYSHRFAARLRKLREDAKLSHADLAESVGVHEKTVWHWESGRSFPSPDSLPDIAGALGVTVRGLMPPE